MEFNDLLPGQQFRPLLSNVPLTTEVVWTKTRPNENGFNARTESPVLGYTDWYITEDVEVEVVRSRPHQHFG